MEVLEDLARLARCESPQLLVPGPIITMAAVAAPHFLYAFIWFKPKAWMRMFPKNPVDAFATAGLLGKRECRRRGSCLHAPDSAHAGSQQAPLASTLGQAEAHAHTQQATTATAAELIRAQVRPAARTAAAAASPTSCRLHAAAAAARCAVLQFAAVLLWFASLRSNGVCLDPGAISLRQWLAFLLLLGYGQSLNVGIFQAIGHAGVYYGFKLGHKIPWVTGWPFDSVSHPQYVGSVLSVWALAALAWGQAPGGALLTLAAYWTAVYVVTAMQEQYL